MCRTHLAKTIHQIFKVYVINTCVFVIHHAERVCVWTFPLMLRFDRSCLNFCIFAKLAQIVWLIYNSKMSKITCYNGKYVSLVTNECNKHIIECLICLVTHRTTKKGKTHFNFPVTSVFLNREKFLFDFFGVISFKNAHFDK